VDIRFLRGMKLRSPARTFTGTAPKELRRAGVFHFLGCSSNVCVVQWVLNTGCQQKHGKVTDHSRPHYREKAFANVVLQYCTVQFETSGFRASQQGQQRKSRRVDHQRTELVLDSFKASLHVPERPSRCMARCS
jgi:hypothetical protein